ncbi:hypothetical protein GGTG_10666 [Gaeumannomyces tritici R3-111a-1]|uniref:Large ribosomal subunit protein bL27m n=1 Tax=Gaeumannomyces tritici (strain R3-111a-1) TaxID=644352 RepID=J3PAZ2_GAET3|nr:hypothetical protein GGTG_10666 [Gaeumannomyces tritici R3-111a-1]EJT71408.1 hypothetical protein GGTG_10666 [Gaeumannomyces tritici R3-111a-1]
MRIVPLQQALRATVAPGCLAAAAGFTFARAQRRPELLASSSAAAAPLGVGQAGKLVEGRRNAAVKSQGAYRIPNKKTIAKKMGAKRSGDQFVIPGNIIYKQRGTIWHPGENTIMGRDHTIHAAVTGYVKYYSDPARHPTRQFIGVAFGRDDTLPYPAHGVRRRRLGMVAVARREPRQIPELSPSGLPTRIVRKEGKAPRTVVDDNGNVTARKRFKKARARVLHEIAIRRDNRVLLLQKDYSYRESNAAIGRLMGRHKGKTPGTVRVGSVKGAYRARRREKAEETRLLREAREQEAAVRKKEADKAAAKKAATAKKAADAAAKAKAKADAAKAKEAAAPKVQA